MIKNYKKKFSEHDIIYKYFKKLNFNKKETFDYKNDGAILKQKLTKDLVVTNDTILESIDFFKEDSPESIAQKIITYNLSDISSLGAIPYAYTLSLSIPNKTNLLWIKKFSNKLLRLQKKYNFFLIGGDISKSRQICISANFYGYVNKNQIIKRETSKINDSIWITGCLGESRIGLLLKQKKLLLNKSLREYYINKYLFPKPCMIGSKIIKFCNSGIDISDGFLGDLSKLLTNNLGAELLSSKLPFSKNTSQLIRNEIIDPKLLLNSGDDYEIIFTAPSNYDCMINGISKKNNLKISKVGRIINKYGIFLDGKKLLKSNNSFQYFF